MSLIQELKRRNVIRVGVLYLVAAWLLLQLTDVLSSLLSVPESAGSIVVMLLVLGFFPVVIFAWVYEMTPEGLRREVDIDRSQSVTPDTGKKINTLTTVLLVLAIGGLIADRLIPEPIVDTEVAAVEPVDASSDNGSNDRSIAVLPFADLSQGQDQQYFTDGLSEELLNLLVRVDELRVASRTSSFAFRGSTLGIPEISKALNVGHILEGSVRKDGDRIRITAQLIEAGTDTHLWSQNFDREFVDIFAIQDEIANAIVNALTGELGTARRPSRLRPPLKTSTPTRCISRRGSFSLPVSSCQRVFVYSARLLSWIPTSRVRGPGLAPLKRSRMSGFLAMVLVTHHWQRRPRKKRCR